jgi:hypothetical protein
LIDARGAYTCANPSCLEKAVQRKAFARAFDDAVLVDFTALIAEVRASLMRRVLENLGLAYLAGQCVPGRTKADEESEQGRAIAIVVSCDLSERSLREVESRPGISMLTGPQKELLGKALGRLETGVVALLKGRISDRIVCDLKRLESLGFAPN